MHNSSLKISACHQSLQFEKCHLTVLMENDLNNLYTKDVLLCLSNFLMYLPCMILYAVSLVKCFIRFKGRYERSPCRLTRMMYRQNVLWELCSNFPSTLATLFQISFKTLICLHSILLFYAHLAFCCYSSCNNYLYFTLPISCMHVKLVLVLYKMQ